MAMVRQQDDADRARFEEIAVRAWEEDFSDALLLIEFLTLYKNMAVRSQADITLDPVARLIVARLACVMGLVNLGDHVYRQVERCKEAITRRRLDG